MISSPNNKFNNREYLEGRHGYYYHIVDDLGAKIIKRGGLSQAQTEYLFLIYAQNHKSTVGMTCEAFACGMVGDNPIIWMKHIDGITCMEYARHLGWGHCSTYNKVEAFLWGYNCSSFAPIIDKMIFIID